MATIAQKRASARNLMEIRRHRAITRAISYAIGLSAFVIVALGYELFARYGGFSPKLVPGLGAIAQALVRLTANGVLLASAAATLYRLIAGFLLACVIGVSVGMLMGHYEWAEDTLLPLTTFFYPIPGLAYAPLFVMWFGLGDLPTIMLVGTSSCFVVIVNTWKGVKAVKPIWQRSARAMGATDRDLFLHVILPGSLPYILIGLRLGLANAWRILIAVEMVTSVQRGLGWMIFGAQTFLNTDVMMATIVVIGAIGLLLEKQVFQRVENYTVARWGMIAT
jgi:ABC-type nitrate/sulfonate/bicarbonate transport system permease component